MEPEPLDVVFAGALRTAAREAQFVLRDFGDLECADTGRVVRVAGARLVAREERREFVITERTLGRARDSCFSLRVTARDDVDFGLWARAFARVERAGLDRVFTVDTAAVLGWGAAGVVFRGARRRDGAPVAVKALSRALAAPAAYASALVARALRDAAPCAQLVESLAVFHTRKETHVVMELVRGPSVADWLAPRAAAPERDARAVFFQLLSALRFLHSARIVHGGVNARNVLLVAAPPAAPIVKLAGFGAATLYAPDGSLVPAPPRSLESVLAAAAHDGVQCIAPEILAGAPPAPATDIWSLGCMLYLLLLGVLPFEGAAMGAGSATAATAPARSSRDVVTERVRMYASMHRSDQRHAVLFPESNPLVERLSPDARSILTQLLAPDPAPRVSAAALLRHPWLTFVSRAPKSFSPTSIRSGDTVVNK